MKKYDLIVIGAGAAGLMAAVEAGKRGRKTLLIEANDKIGEKIRISGGGRCNFTNIDIDSKNYISNNPHFVKSALAKYTQHDFINLIKSYNIGYHEKTLGQLFCNISSKQIIDMFLNECQKYNVQIILRSSIEFVSKSEDFYVKTVNDDYYSTSLIVATGGLSIPKIGASDFAYKIAKQFSLNIIETKPALVPLITEQNFSALSGIAVPSIISYKNISFAENLLFTHKGLSGPAILQISSYIDIPGQITINLLPELNLIEKFLEERNSKILISKFLKDYLPNRLVDYLSSYYNLTKRIVDCKVKELELISDQLHNFQIKIISTEGYVKAEVTKGGVDTNELSSKTMSVNKVPNLYFIGEAIDVTGWLGGYNFQWAWSSGFVAGCYA